MSFIFVLFMLHLLTVCALYVCLCDYVNMCMYLVLLCIFGKKLLRACVYCLQKPNSNKVFLSYSATLFHLLLFVVKSTTHRQAKMHFRPSNPQLTSTILQIQYVYSLILMQYMIITNVFHWTIFSYALYIIMIIILYCK